MVRPKEKVKLTCVVCGREYDMFPYRATTSKYCSKRCWSKRNRPRIKPCEFCGKEFSTYHDNQRYCSRSCARKIRPGNAFKDGKSMLRDRARLSEELKEWREAVYARDGYKCTRCSRTGYLHAHHIKSWADYPGLRFDVDNGVTLCADCHSRAHGRNLVQRRKKKCPECGAETTGRGVNGRCRSCAVKRSWVKRYENLTGKKAVKE